MEPHDDRVCIHSQNVPSIHLGYAWIYKARFGNGKQANTEVTNAMNGTQLAAVVCTGVLG